MQRTGCKPAHRFLDSHFPQFITDRPNDIYSGSSDKLQCIGVAKNKEPGSGPFYRRQQNQMTSAAIKMSRIAISKHHHQFGFCHATTMRRIESSKRRNIAKLQLLPCGGVESPSPGGTDRWRSPGRTNAVVR